MNTVLFCVYAAVTLVAVIFTALREFHMFQLNGYKTPEHTRWMLKNKKRYIWMILLFCLQVDLAEFVIVLRLCMLRDEYSD